MDGGKFCVFDRSVLVSNGVLHSKNVKAVFDAVIKVVLRPPKLKKHKRRYKSYSKVEPVLLHYLYQMKVRQDLREDKQFKKDYPGACIIATEQGEELKKQIGAVAYVDHLDHLDFVAFS